jgi:hypothetical protein
MPEPLSYAGLVEFMAAMPRLPRYTLHADPLAIELLKQVITPRAYTVFDEMQSITGIDIFPEYGWEPGRYELRKDDEVIKEGNLCE